MGGFISSLTWLGISGILPTSAFDYGTTTTYQVRLAYIRACSNCTPVTQVSSKLYASTTMTLYSEDMDTQEILKSLTLEEKVRLLSGTPNDFVSISGIPEKKITPLKVRGIRLPR